MFRTVCIRSLSIYSTMKTIFKFVIMTAFCCCETTQENVQKSFIDNEIVPDILTVPPKKILNISYPSGVIVNLGNELTPTQVKDKPQVTWDAEKDTYYTLVMADLDVPTRSKPDSREIRHWLVINIPGSSIEMGDEVIEYVGSAPPKETGLHRYVFLVFKQNNGKITHNEPRSSNRMIDNRMKTSTNAIAKKYDLGDPEFGNFFQAQYDSYVDVFWANFQK